MTYFERHNLRQTGRYAFAMNCPYCPDGTLTVCVDPQLRGTELEFDHYGIRVRQCAPGCTCPLTDRAIRRIERECERRAENKNK